MLGWRQIGWFAAGFLLAGLTGLLAAPAGASAQGVTSEPYITRIRPSPPRAKPAPPPIPEDVEPAVRLRGTIHPDEGGASSIGADGHPASTLDRPASGDEPGDPRQPDPPLDGVIDVGDPARDADRLYDGTRDTRSAEDYDAFERPPAGFDPEVFAVEVEPILDRRPERLARFEPYQATGIRVGTFIAYPEVESEVGIFSNVFRSPVQPRSDIAYDVRPSLRVVSNWRVHALEFRATGRASFHDEYASEDDRAYTIEARGRIDLTRRTNIEALVSQGLTQDSRSDISAPTSARERGDIYTSRAAVTLNHRINRLSVQLRGTITDTDYAPVETLSGLTVSNDDRDVTAYEAALRAQWELRPMLSVFAELAHNVRQHEAAPSDGISRDSRGDRLRAGVSFGNTGQTLRGEASIGYGSQRPDDSRLSDIAGLIVDANVGYRWSALTSILVTARSEIGETTLPGVAGAFSRQAGIELRHALRRNLFAIAGLSSTWQDYDGASLRERELIASLAAELFINREIALYARFQHIDFTSTDPGRSFDADEFRIGLRIRR